MDRSRGVRLRPHLVFLSAILLATGIRSEPLFEAPALSFDVGLEATSVAIGDLNGDGRPDLAISKSGSIAMLYGEGDGTFGARTDLATTDAPRQVELADLNGDGNVDLLIAAATGLDVRLGSTGGSFGPGVVYTTGGTPAQFELTDLNGDDWLDVAVANQLTGSVLLGNGDGTFGPKVDLPASFYPVTLIAAGEFDQDALPDLVLGHGYDYSVTFVLGNGDGTFRPHDELFGFDSAPLAVAAADLNLDGRDDVVVGKYFTAHPPTSTRVHVFMGLAGGEFAPRINLDPNSFPRSLCIVDLNQDGWPDIAAGGDMTSVFLGSSGGTFAPAIKYTGLLDIGTGDLNADGRPDLVGVTSPTVNVLLGNAAGALGIDRHVDIGRPPDVMALGDLNNDERLDFVTANSYEPPNSSVVSISTFLGNGDATFELGSHHSMPLRALGLVLGDLNSDERLDLVIGQGYFSALSATVLYGNGDGTFGARSSLPTPSEVSTVAVGDINGDGWLDVAAGSNVYLSLFLGNGDGTFGPRLDVTVPQFPRSILFRHLNADAHMDVIVAAQGRASILLGNGDGTFAARTDYLTGGNSTSGDAGDLNGDTHLDIAVSGGGFNNDLHILLGRGDGTFVLPPIVYPRGPGAPVAIHDLDGDGRLDVCGLGSGYWVSVRFGKSDGTLGPACGFGTGDAPKSLPIGDLNGDTRPDIAVANFLSHSVSLLLNTGGTTVGVQRLSATASGGHVQLCWNLSIDTLRDLDGIHVERAGSPEGPYLERGHAALPPATDMCFEEAGVEPGNYWYRIVLETTDGSRRLFGPFAVSVQHGSPGRTHLHAPSMPKNGAPVQIRYAVARARTLVRLAVYDVRGRVQWASTPDLRDPGEHTVTWDRRDPSGRAVATGVYFIGLDAGGVRDSKKLVLVRD